MAKSRLDQHLVDLSLAPSRARAQALIKAGVVTVDGVPARKPSQTVSADAAIRLCRRLAAFDLALSEDFFVVLGFSLAAIFLPRLGQGHGRAKGWFLLLAYGIYTAWLYQSRSF